MERGSCTYFHITTMETICIIINVATNLFKKKKSEKKSEKASIKSKRREKSDI